MESCPDSDRPTVHDPLLAVVAAIAQGQEASLGALYDATSPRVFGLALRIARDRSAAEEATVDVFAQVWRQARRYDPSKGTVISWLLNLTRSRAIDLYRSRSRQDERSAALAADFDLADPAPDPEDASVDNERARIVREAMQSLPREQRQTLEAIYFGGLSHTQAAAALAQPLGTVKTRARMGLAALRSALPRAYEGLE